MSLFSRHHAEGYHAPPIRPGLSRPYHHCTAITPVYISRLSRHSLVLLLGYHTRAITLHHTRKTGYHTRHSSQFVVYRSPAITPRIFLHLHHHPGATRTNLLHSCICGPMWIECNTILKLVEEVFKYHSTEGLFVVKKQPPLFRKCSWFLFFGCHP